MNQQDILIDALTEQKKTAKMVWLIVAFAMPLILLLLIVFLVPDLSDDGMIKYVFYGILAAVGLPIYLYFNWHYYKKYKFVEADLQRPTLLTIQTTLTKLSHRYDDDSNIDYYIAKFRNGFSCQVKSSVAKKLTIGREYALIYFIVSKAIFEIKSSDKKTVVSSKQIIR